jgi:uncharacterized protein
MDKAIKYTNYLVNESSPYLQQHAHNPVDWYPWGKEALEKGKQGNKLLFISIGYSACHWCHVMERESFENEEIAAILNQYFVSIKIDREQRPDLDQIYMNAIQLITGSGGWPLTCIALPDGRPVWGGTYFTPNHLKEILTELSDEWLTKPQIFIETAHRLTTEINKNGIITSKAPISLFSMEHIHDIYVILEKLFDLHNGGYLQRQKFPMPSDWLFIMKYSYYTKNTLAMDQVNLTLTKMALGGIYDQIGGGFARYSTDELWKVPHFEKMLYDNAQLISLYCNAWKGGRDPLYQKVVNETMNFIIREMLSEESGFYSSIDADSEGKEGEYYVWEKSELEQCLGDDANLFEEYFNITSSGNWENGKNILYKKAHYKGIYIKYNLTEQEFDEKISSMCQKLMVKRLVRKRPLTDNKILTSWNALMLSAFVDAYRTFGKKQWLDLALKNAQFIKRNLLKTDYSLYRTYKQPYAEIDGFLDDYALCMLAFIDLYQATLDEAWLTIAKNLADYTILHFYDKQSGMFFYSSDLSEVIISRKMELFDNVIPSSNSAIAHALFMLGTYYDEDKYKNITLQMVTNMKSDIQQHGAYNSNWLSLILWTIYPPKEVVITGKHALEKLKAIEQYYFPDIIVAGNLKESKLPLLKDKFKPSKTLVYICVNKQCRLPLENMDEVIDQLGR